MSVDPRRQQRQDTYDLREQILADDNQQHLQAHADAAVNYGTDEEEHSMLEDDSEPEEGEELFEEDGSSTLSIPNESIDFDMVYALHSFAATVEGQANVVKGDSLYLMDDSNSYWWLVRVLKTQEVGYIPAENIETPFERLARLNKHRNIDLASATQAEQQESLLVAQDRVRHNIQFGNGPSPSPDPNRAGSRSNHRRSIHFNPIRSNHRYIPPLKDGEIEDEDDEWLLDGYEDADEDLAAEQMYLQGMDEDDMADGMEHDDGMQWDESSGDLQDVQLHPGEGLPIPDSLQPGSMREHQEQLRLRAYQQEQLQQHEQMLERQKLQRLQLQQQQQQAQMAAQKASAMQGSDQQQTQTSQRELRTSNSRERLAQDAALSQGQRPIDPAEATETRKMTVTPNIARDYDDHAPAPDGSFAPNIVVEDERLKRLRDEDSSDESLKKKSKGKDKLAAPVSSATYNSKQAPAKLRKEKEPSTRSDTEDEGKDKKKKGSVFGGLFGRGKKDKDKGKDRSGSIGSLESSDYVNRGSEESSRSGHRPPDGQISPTTTTAQQQQQAISLRNAVSDIRAASQADQSTPSTPERAITPQVSEHASQLRERDQQQRDLYKQYLNRSPSSPPETQPSYGLQSASSVMLSSPSTSSALGPPVARPRPGSLILTSPSANDGQANLSVIRVFAGRNLQTEATFKTVLLNASTTASDLVKQAIQRFRLPSGEDASDYYLTVKQVERGDSAVLQSNENPLVVFETLVVEAMELPKVKRSSVGSISSVSSNLSMHPAIKKLSMNDFTDDSAVKFYLNRKGDDSAHDSLNGYQEDETLTADVSHGDIELQSPKSQYLTSSSAGNVLPERFTSPSTRFAMQLVIYADDLPDDMQFHPQTEAIVLKNTLSDPHAPVLVSPVLRRKIFMFPKNVTVAEVTEISLERFGIQDGVIDGGDEVEDKTTKRRSGVRVRYGLMVSTDGQERELSPSSKIVDAFPRPPQYRAPDRQIPNNKRRSLDSSQLLGSIDDIRPDDPVFVLRRATSYRNSTSRRRSFAPLDEIALQQLHRESTSSYNSEVQGPLDESKAKQPSRQEIIAAQRAATRATQRAIVSTSTNSVRGMDVLLPGNAVLRSSRYETSDRIRYSYVEPDGETYDISDIIEQEWRDIDGNKKDLLEGVFNRNKDGIGEKLDRVLHKIRKGKGKERGHSMSLSLSSTDSHRLSTRSTSISEYSADDVERSVTPGSAALGANKMYVGGEEDKARSTPVANVSPDSRTSRPGTTTPTSGARPIPPHPVGSRRNPSITSVMSNQSGRATPPTNYNLPRVDEEQKQTTPQRSPQQRRIVIPKNHFGLSNMMAIIEYKASQVQKPLEPLDPVDELLFGRPIDQESLHPQVREIYGPAFKQLEEMDKILDSYIGRSVVGAF